MKNFLIVIALLVMQTTASADPITMQAFAANGKELSGAEYWPYVASKKFTYPDDVLWGFYPAAGDSDGNATSATPAALDCAAQAYAELVTFFNDHPPLLDKIIENGESHLITNKFYIWVNDYSTADNPYPFDMRTNNFWYWTRNPQAPGRTPGFWKWESTLTQDLQCLTPDSEQIHEYLETKWNEISQ